MAEGRAIARLRGEGKSFAEIGEEFDISASVAENRHLKYIQTHRDQHFVDAHITKTYHELDSIAEAVLPEALMGEKDAIGSYVKVITAQGDLIGISKQKPIEPAPNISITFSGVDAPVTIDGQGEAVSING